MDRFTGSQVWNQPVAAYRILPTAGNTDSPIQQGDLKLWPVTIGMKIYWASDSVGYDFQRTTSLNWNVADPNFSNDTIPDQPASFYAQDRASDGAYVSRYLSFTLFFDAPVQMSADHTQVISAGNMVGDGVWSHADQTAMATWYPYGYENSQTHPDFLWRPDDLADADYRNPSIDPLKVYKYILKQSLGDFGTHLKH